MTSEIFSFGMLFLGMALGSLSPFKVWGWIIFMSIATVFIFVDLFLSRGRKQNDNFN